MTKTPLMICAYRSSYLDIVLNWLTSEGIENNYRVFIWDNGGAKQISAAYGFESYAQGDGTSGRPTNVGKAIAMQYLVDIVAKVLPDATCYVCMDDDVIVDCDHLDALVAAAHRTPIGMVAAGFHPFNSAMPPGGSIVEFDRCPVCSAAKPRRDCPHCGGSGKDPQGLRLRTYSAKDRTVNRLGKVAGGLFAVSKSAVSKTEYAPYLYPILTRQGDNSPIVYWSEDATLDVALASKGFMNGYLEMPRLTPAIHLPELDQEYMQWKLKAQKEPPVEGFKSKKE